MHLGAVNLNLLVSLHALLEERSVSRAAARVGLSQPSMSHALGNLRELLGDPLLVRCGRRMVPTPRALELAGPVEQAIARARDVFAAPHEFDPATARIHFTLSLPDVAQLVLLPRLLEVLAEQAPSVTLRIDPRAHGFDPSALERGDVDLVAALQRPLLPVLRSEEVVPSAPMACLVRCGHPAKRLTLRRYLGLPHLAVGGPGLMSRALEARGLEQKVALRVPSFLVAPWIVARSDMVATLPRWMAQRFAATLPVEVRPSPIPLEHPPIAMIWHERTEHDPAQRWLRALVRKIAREAFPRPRTV
jgi:DNA-binding transcriptional LysR family regulator